MLSHAAEAGLAAGNVPIMVCIPVFDDWDCVGRVVQQLDRVLHDLDVPVGVLLIDDGSTKSPPRQLNWQPEHLKTIDILQLRRNVGHQRAIALGLTFLYVHHECGLVVVMDGDGEDAPRDVLTLVKRCEQNERRNVVFAQRCKRSEGPLFRLGYVAYRALHRILTGRSVRMGNFSVVPRCCLERMVSVSEMWNHYAASVVKARVPVDMVPIPRAKRLMGRSTMDLPSLITHGLSAISVHADTMGARLLPSAACLMVVAAIALVVVVVVRLFTDLVIPGWATSAAGMLVILIVNAVLLMTMFAFFSLQGRNMSGFVPLRDYEHYILREVRLHGRTCDER